ncbi:hypothetical protein E4U91_25755 [Streptomyces lasalocidi]|uniref:Uncharacterized protein n=2 Tax=Streptomyces lasalocidi TaxID=324833 RepID=A0A4V6AWA8_STRLS|nr:hypothetical protein E4U91_25755 [Streptomyces lasalocidi]
MSPARVTYGVIMGVFARLLRRSKTTEEAVTQEVAPEAIPVADEAPADGDVPSGADVPASGAVPASEEAPTAVAVPVADEAASVTDVGAEAGSAIDAAASVSTEAPAPADASEAEPEATGSAAETVSEADSADADADGVEIPRQQSADEAADREADEGART